VYIPSVVCIVDEDDLYRHPDHGEPCTVVNACRNASLIAARANASARKGSRDRRRDTACLKSENVSGSVIAIGDTAENGDDRIHVGRHAPADRITTPLRIGLGAATAVRGTGRPAGNANGDAMTLAWRFLDDFLDPHLDPPAGREVVLVEEAFRGTEPEL
jgi:hypothetical protein